MFINNGTGTFLSSVKGKYLAHSPGAFTASTNAVHIHRSLANPLGLHATVRPSGTLEAWFHQIQGNSRCPSHVMPLACPFRDHALLT